MYNIHNSGWNLHCKMRNPMEDVGRFMHECAKDPVTRVMSTTALVLALCQTAGPTMISQPPGFILINAGDEPADPIDALMKTLIGMTRPGPRPKAEDFERNRQTMKVLLLQKKSERDKPILDFFDLPEPSGCSESSLFLSALANNYGGGRAGWYADRRDVDYGWGTDASGHTILRLDRAEDLRQLREDVRLHPERLSHPTGYGAEMKEEPKKLSLAGSLPAADWDNHLVDGIIHNALPVLFLPHTASHPLATPGHLALDWIGFALAGEAVKSQATPVEIYQRLDPITVPWFRERMTQLRERLHHFPADYEFFVMRSVRELLPCCRRLVGITASGRTKQEEQLNLTFDMFSTALHGVALGIESLGWHGYGFECPGGQNALRRVLRAIRERGSISKRDLQRNQQWLTAESRDAIVGALVAEGLVMTTDNEITALPFADYWQRIIHRSFGEMPEPRWQGAPRRQEAVS
jgi:hypothetical protein